DGFTSLRARDFGQQQNLFSSDCGMLGDGGTYLLWSEFTDSLALKAKRRSVGEVGGQIEPVLRVALSASMFDASFMIHRLQEMPTEAFKAVRSESVNRE